MDKKPEAQADAGASAASSQSVERVAFKGGILGVKAGMTQVFTEQGDSVAVTVIDLSPTVITQVKTKEKNGYQAIQIGMLPKKAKAASRSEQGHAKAVNAAGFYHSQEFRLAETDKLDGLVVGKVLSPEFVKPGDMVDVSAMSKGKGYQGGMKRYHMQGGHKTHGASVTHRHTGSIGNRADPGRVFKGKKMAGHMGHVRTTIQNVVVIRVDVENQIMLVHGSVPGPRSGIVEIRPAVKHAE